MGLGLGAMASMPLHWLLHEQHITSTMVGFDHLDRFKAWG